MVPNRRSVDFFFDSPRKMLCCLLRGRYRNIREKIIMIESSSDATLVSKRKWGHSQFWISMEYEHPSLS